MAALGITWILDGLEVTLSDRWPACSPKSRRSASARGRSVIFFFASAGASAAYLTVSEIFPLEMRAMAIAFFYALGTAVGGLGAPAFFGFLISQKSPQILSIGYYIGAGLMIAAGLVEVLIGVKAERQSLESVARPMTAEAAPA